MGRKYAIYDQQALHFVTFTVVNWIDVFIRDEYQEIILSSLQYCQKEKGLNVHAYCIMTSHVHLILSVDESLSLSNVIRDLKSYISRQMKHCIGNNLHESRREWLMWMFERAGNKNKRNGKFQFWQQHNHPIELSTKTMVDQRLAYLHNNPVKAGFVDDPCSWIWSSCAAYEQNVDTKLKLAYI